ncbi:hypothetical protein VT50_0205350 [Streptomyces antioxidans]|uniref:Uncharacterized protein n=1 Tax=Streptomyces antioxidans TaxID=1507734 RepID=A0A1V4DAL9_9ACTN|nr:hypothetical protein VT50_0205350 [Streptomyces antioxidans]
MSVTRGGTARARAPVCDDLRVDYPNDQAPGAPVRSGIPEHGRVPNRHDHHDRHDRRQRRLRRQRRHPPGGPRHGRYHRRRRRPGRARLRRRRR